MHRTAISAHAIRTKLILRNKTPIMLSNGTRNKSTTNGKICSGLPMDTVFTDSSIQTVYLQEITKAVNEKADMATDNGIIDKGCE